MGGLLYIGFQILPIKYYTKSRCPGNLCEPLFSCFLSRTAHRHVYTVSAVMQTVRLTPCQPRPRAREAISGTPGSARADIIIISTTRIMSISEISCIVFGAVCRF